MTLNMSVSTTGDRTFWEPWWRDATAQAGYVMMMTTTTDKLQKVKKLK